MALQRGVVLYQPSGISQQTVTTLQVAGCRLVRLELSSVDDAGTVAYLVSHGISVIALIPVTIVPGATKANWQAPESSPVFTQYVRDYANACAMLALAMPGVAVWEILNEPASLGSAFHMTPIQYSRLYNAAHIALRGTSKGTVITGGIFAHTMARYGGATKGNSSVEWLRQVIWELNLQSLPLDIDGAAYHPYLSGLDALPQYLTWLTEVTGPKPVYITEAGAESGVLGMQGQADYLRTLYAVCARFPTVVATCWMSLDDFVSEGKVRTWGLEAPGALERKASFAVFKALP